MFLLMHVFFVSCMWDFALMVVHKSGIKLEWLIYFLVCPNEVTSGRLVNICSAGCNNCRSCIDTHLTFPELSCTSEALSEIFLQIWKLGLYFESKVSLGVSFHTKTMSSILKFLLLGSLMWGHLSLAIFRFNTAILYISHMAPRWILHFSFPK